jgi:pilus assembly protein CpaF
VSASFQIILPFVRPLVPMIQDPEVSEIMVNPGGAVFQERDGLLTRVEGVRIEERPLQTAVKNIARLLGNDISEIRPLLDARLPDGSRVSAAMPPASVGGTTMNIRKFRNEVLTAPELVRRGMLSQGLLDRLRAVIEARQTILISGGTGTGKTTLLNALAAYLPERERIVLIEETAEVAITLPNLVRLEAQKGHPATADFPEGIPAVTIRDLLKHALRMRPDRIIIGEVREGEAFDLLQALNTGHEGTLTTIHANSAKHTAMRLRTLVSMAHSGLPDSAIGHMIGDAIHCLVHIGRDAAGHRKVSSVLKVEGYDASTDRYQFEEIQ